MNAGSGVSWHRPEDIDLKVAVSFEILEKEALPPRTLIVVSPPSLSGQEEGS